MRAEIRQRTAFLFPGQGAQFSGMGKDVTLLSPSALSVFEKFDSIRPGTSELCFSGSEDLLKITSNTQPCMVATELAILSVLRENGIDCGMAAGFSLGEISALCACGVLSPEDSFSLACERGRIMDEVSREHDTFMAAVVKLNSREVADICYRFDGVYPVNFNCPGQTVVAGPSEIFGSFSSETKKAGGMAIKLKVSGAFHSPYMKKASEMLGKYLSEVEFSSPDRNLRSNLTGGSYPEDIRQTLAKHVCNPVLWEQEIRGMIADGADIFVEVGPGSVLSGFISRIDPCVKCFQAGNAEEINKLIRQFGENCF